MSTCRFVASFVVECTQCHHKSFRDEFNNDLIAITEHFVDIKTSLEEYTKVEHLDGANKVHFLWQSSITVSRYSIEFRSTHVQSMTEHTLTHSLFLSYRISRVFSLSVCPLD